MYKVLKLEEFKQIKESYQGILIRNIFTINQILQKESVKSCNYIIMPYNLFEDILKLGAKINKIDDDLTIDNKEEEIIKLSKNWIDNNYYPYPVDEQAYYYEKIICKKFGYDIQNIYLMFSLMSLLSKLRKKIRTRKKKCEILNIDDFKEIRYYTDKLKIKELIYSDFDYTNFIEFTNLNIDLFNEFLDFDFENINISENIILNFDKVFFPIIQNIIITYITKKLSNFNYLIINSHPILIYRNNTIPEYHIYSEAYCIMGIIYHILIKYIITEKDNISLGQCPYCKILFEKKGNQLYCDECIGKGIPKKIRDERFNKSPKGREYHKAYYKDYNKKE